jgi:hypothetical protein
VPPRLCFLLLTPSKSTRSKTPPPPAASPPPPRPYKMHPRLCLSAPYSLLPSFALLRIPSRPTPLHRRCLLLFTAGLTWVTKARGEDRQDPLYLFLQPRRAPCPCIVDEPALRQNSGGVLSSGPPWTEAPPGLRVVDPVHRLFLLKNNSISYKF